MKSSKDNKCEKPKNISEYISWIEKINNECCSPRVSRYYESVISVAKDSFLVSPFWKGLTNSFKRFDQEYYISTDYHLFAEELQDIYKKPFDSVVDKTFRRNVIYNDNWPEPSDNNEFIFPENGFCYLNDCLRTTIVVKYLDGVKYILDKLIQMASHYEIEHYHDYEAKDEGYYAVHFYLIQEFEVPSQDWDTRRIKMKIEIQIKTQIQDTVRKLTHKYYEDRRSKASKKNIKWQWDYKDDAFVVNYMGHILHYLEGMIMEIRDKERK